MTGSVLGGQIGFLPTVSRLPSTMADNVNEESDYIPGKDELDWGYEEGKLVFISMNGSWFKRFKLV